MQCKYILTIILKKKVDDLKEREIPFNLKSEN